ncbi:MAG: hypothetical protein ACE5OR_01995 [bacterium]
MKKLRQDFEIIKKCVKPTSHGAAILASPPPGVRYPYVYPRDISFAARLLHQLSKKPSFKEESLTLLEDIARFILHCQREDGYWGQRYDLKGREKSIYKQEDNVAHGLFVLLNYALGALEIGEDFSHKDQIREAVRRGIDFAVKEYYRQEINLFFSTTSVHETPIERGYSIWVNFAYLQALRMALKLFEHLGVKDQAETLRRLLARFEKNVRDAFSRGSYYIRRFTPEGEIDFRADITLLSPFYFGIESPDSEGVKNTVDYLEHHLWDPEFGGLQRYLPFTEDLSTHIHAGNGPWMNYTAMLARYHYCTGNIARGDQILAIIDKYRDQEGYIPEHISTYQRFDEFIRLEWNTRLEYRKEFADDMLLPEVPFNHIVEELNNMRRAYDKVRKLSGRGREEIIRFACPLMWSHVEYGLALIERAKSRSNK